MRVVDLYTVQIVIDNEADWHADAVRAAAAAVPECEENLSLMLPAGYRARIRRWDHADEPTQEDDDE